ncbi:MAG: T9SS type A sorting domain-containing protein, partial [Bacteroidota bacterium]
ATPETVDAWLEVDLPDGRTRQFGPPATRTLQPGETLMATLSKRLQGGAPAGTYTVTGCVGQQAAGLVYDTDVFTFEKEGPPSRPAADMTIEPLLAAALDDVFVVPSEAFEIVAADVRGLPEAAGLLAPRPNPFASRTTLTVALPAPANVRLSVVDARGREVAVLAEGHREAGHHASVLEGGNLPPGVYLVRLLVDGQPLATRRVLLAR